MAHGYDSDEPDARRHATLGLNPLHPVTNNEQWKEVLVSSAPHPFRATKQEGAVDDFLSKQSHLLLNGKGLTEIGSLQNMSKVSPPPFCAGRAGRTLSSSEKKLLFLPLLTRAPAFALRRSYECCTCTTTI